MHVQPFYWHQLFFQPCSIDINYFFSRVYHSTNCIIIKKYIIACSCTGEFSFWFYLLNLSFVAICLGTITIYVVNECMNAPPDARQTLYVISQRLIYCYLLRLYIFGCIDKQLHNVNRDRIYIHCNHAWLIIHHIKHYKIW